MEDHQLMQSFQAGSKESFEALIIKYRANAIAFARQLVGDAATAEDIAQESFADIYVNKDRYNGKASFKTYLFTIIKYKCIDHLRKARYCPLDEQWASDSDSIEDALLSKERQQLVKSKLELLKEDYRMVLYLVEYEELSYQEAGKVMGKNLAQIKILVYRAKKKLRELIEQEV